MKNGSGMATGGRPALVRYLRWLGTWSLAAMSIGCSSTSGGAGDGGASAELIAACQAHYNPTTVVTTAMTSAWPDECRAPELQGTVQAMPESSNARSIDVVVQDGVLISVQGQPCAFCTPSGSEVPTFDADLYPGRCATSWICGTGSADASFWNLYLTQTYDHPGAEVAFWQLENTIGSDPATAGYSWNLGTAGISIGCTPSCPGSCGDDGCGGSCGECQADEACFEGTDMPRCEKLATGGGADGGTGGAACTACIEQCQGQPGCCTGSGCTCEGACMPTSCVSGTTYCCGPDGSCFCLSDCPY